ncbi:Sec-independent protein translocase subunit TatA [Pseudoglutamicibacter albus]|uniref:Sec-independent protein translocase protein TatA n=1 Tax=Pseudoglutamicibacter albus TaxID=98671 RepID=A0ABU1YYN5_9MICC|nr:Sec-independent protein translocase subunit TatA [Pseudoglutamicibacter albus]MDR7293462.1 sec-independent protein translocase protein TatA [Pseudoglutamicibacter albus]
MHAPSPIAWAIIIVVILVLFALPKLPTIARSLGESTRIFKSEMRQMKKDEEAAKASEKDGKAESSSAENQPKEPLEGRIVDTPQAREENK